ncbi:hypothetical protein AXF42_Ash010717 [Apostasia shenzhenica]|uniref:Uncharacterized protein n=1 Tax=Apostasia shenzhenica TaxID=1088818 RepID=A0A2I0A6W7_9ASPA|nr:hypothetical protein AXF42_Ash010717 [Apostasia shenzhenica]
MIGRGGELIMKEQAGQTPSDGSRFRQGSSSINSYSLQDILDSDDIIEEDFDELV